MIPEAREARQLAEMTWEEARDIDRGRTVAVLPVGAIEAHGPHLPLATDCVIAQGREPLGPAPSRSGASKLIALSVGVPTLLSFSWATPSARSRSPTTTVCDAPDRSAAFIAPLSPLPPKARSAATPARRNAVTTPNSRVRADSPSGTAKPRVIRMGSPAGAVSSTGKIASNAKRAASGFPFEG